MPVTTARTAAVNTAAAGHRTEHPIDVINAEIADILGLAELLEAVDLRENDGRGVAEMARVLQQKAERVISALSDLNAADAEN